MGKFAFRKNKGRYIVLCTKAGTELARTMFCRRFHPDVVVWEGRTFTRGEDQTLPFERYYEVRAFHATATRTRARTDLPGNRNKDLPDTINS